ncbi:hypothetical protein DBR41_01190 [Pseudomonas sp. HMWF010]|nr:hypothetical protein DBR21_12725 [Caulobacter sp. HMWF009]PTT05703.1 hypothetical protein DBR10_14860 [Caulobacter sp. HMWF025]PTT86208.1 hypothetical protein DBR41_01190 [Pseudomonas sp. HMWF010]
MSLGPIPLKQLVETGANLDIDCSHLGPIPIEDLLRAARPGQRLRLYCPQLGPAPLLKLANLAGADITIAV